ncbi:MAG TPA: right-handed parallel beta-helix repeat-containing protein [Thermoanaerobaculia bacterium]|nr:right-handed parallel beta-helix repeat-containing protein [Thermoanaerobaculia bacterium]
MTRLLLSLFLTTQLLAQATELRVVTVADSGPGSLRQAIVDANALCAADGQACRISFAMLEPLPEAGWYTIRPRTPLPEVTAASIVIDGRTQPDTNPAGPEIFLDGSHAVADGPGLFFRTVDTKVYGLAVGNFRGNGMTIVQPRPGAHLIARNYLGVDPTGERAAANGGRGLEVLGGGTVTVEDNVLSGNVRSGAYLWTRGALVQRNRIGVGAHTDALLGNFASGIFMGEAIRLIHGRNEILENVIANNAEFGVALAVNALTTVSRNRIEGNGLGGIDVRLDGPTAGTPANPAVPGTPVLLRAYFDGTGTIIEGFTRLSLRTPLNDLTVSSSPELYANAAVDAQGFAEGQRYLGTPEWLEAAQPPGTTDSYFRLRYEADLRGLWITAIGHQSSSYFNGEYVQFFSSEFSRPVKVG